tara:strand:+ start:1850 stop:3520 length:1671 start_codon:yes stop_codon:yes gene_type:complete
MAFGKKKKKDKASSRTRHFDYDERLPIEVDHPASRYDSFIEDSNNDTNKARAEMIVMLNNAANSTLQSPSELSYDPEFGAEFFDPDNPTLTEFDFTHNTMEVIGEIFKKNLKPQSIDGRAVQFGIVCAIEETPVFSEIDYFTHVPPKQIGQHKGYRVMAPAIHQNFGNPLAEPNPIKRKEYIKRLPLIRDWEDKFSLVPGSLIKFKFDSRLNFFGDSPGSVVEVLNGGRPRKIPEWAAEDPSIKEIMEEADMEDVPVTPVGPIPEQLKDICSGNDVLKLALKYWGTDYISTKQVKEEAKDRKDGLVCTSFLSTVFGDLGFDIQESPLWSFDGKKSKHSRLLKQGWKENKETGMPERNITIYKMINRYKDSGFWFHEIHGTAGVLEKVFLHFDCGYRVHNYKDAKPGDFLSYGSPGNKKEIVEAGGPLIPFYKGHMSIVWSPWDGKYMKILGAHGRPGRVSIISVNPAGWSGYEFLRFRTEGRSDCPEADEDALPTPPPLGKDLTKAEAIARYEESGWLVAWPEEDRESVDPNYKSAAQISAEAQVSTNIPTTPDEV